MKSDQYFVDHSKNYAVVTTCTSDFIPGTLVMIYSFLKYNKWYKGDFIILVEAVTPDIKRFLSYMPNVKFQVVGKEILTRSARIAEIDETKKRIVSHFYSIELFNLRGYEKLFSMDSDVLILGDLIELFKMDAPMICVGDGFYYKDILRDGSSYTQYTPKPGEDTSQYWSDCFNAGLILFDRSLVTPKHYKELTQMINFNYNTKSTRFHEQRLQNIYFRGQYKLVSAKYNYRIGIAEQIKEKDGVSLEDAVVIHYTARKKPWLFKEALNRTLTNPKYLPIFQLWQQHWMELMDKLSKENAF